MPTEPQECKDFALVIPLTRGLYAVIDLEDYALVSRFKWRAMKSKGSFYARAYLPGNKALAMHRLIAKTARGQWPDHRDGNTLNNRRSNLRIATRSQNNANRSGSGKTPFKGVRRNPHSTANAKRVWLARVAGIYLGGYETSEEAARAYDTKARELYGEFACVNFPREGERQA